MRTMKWIAVALALVAAVAFGAALVDSDPAAAEPDTIFYNGKFFTADESFDIVEALAVRDGRIVATGSRDDVLALAAEGTELVDLEGRTVVPGFHDSHVHLRFGGRRGHDFRSVRNVQELRSALREAAARVPRGEWIVGRISETAFPESRLPTRWELDEAAPDHPVALPRGHIWVVNSRALALAGIDSSTPQPPGGTIAKDERGEATGVLRENPAHRRVERLLPPTPELTDTAAERNLREMLRELVSLGITGGNVAGLRPGADFRRVQGAYEKWGDELPRLTLQLRVRPGYDMYDDLDLAVRNTVAEIEGLSFRTGFGNDRLKIGAIKMSVDGGFTGQAAWMLVPYPDGRTGNTRIPREPLYRVVKYAHDRGWQLGIHAIGDGGVQLAVDALDQVMRENPRPDPRHYLHHVSVVPPEETLEQMAANDIIVSSQPNFTYDLAPYYASAMSGERLAHNNPQRTLLDRGIRLAYGSDHRPYGPIAGIYAAVTRRGRDGEVYGIEEAVRVEEAIRFATAGSAYITFDEDELGTLEPGKYADMVVLTGDILTVPPERIREIGVERTIIGGEVVYTAERPRVAIFDDGVTWYAQPPENERAAPQTEEAR